MNARFVFLNDHFVPEAEATVSVFDRGFLYGDGLFETLRVFGGKPFRWTEHIERLERGAAFIKIKLPFAADELRRHAAKLIELNQMPDSLLRITLSRGIGVRGYSPKGAEQPTLVMSLHDAPALRDKLVEWRVITASCRLPSNEPLAQFKTCNKLPQILARAEADEAGVDEALLLNTDGAVVEASTSNLFWIRDGGVGTPPLQSGILAGVTRLVVLEICHELNLTVHEQNIRPMELHRVEGVFLSLSSWGIVEVISLDGRDLARTAQTQIIRDAYEKMRGCRP